MLVAGILFFSCKKNAAAASAAPVDDDAYKIAEIINGKVFAGTISGAAEGDMQSINYNNGNQFILVEDIPGMVKVDVPSLPSAELITSVYGVIIKDVASNKLVLLANNDAESIKKFEEVKAALHGSYVSTTVFGITVVHAEKI
jgi:hypothetical protein